MRPDDVVDALALVSDLARCLDLVHPAQPLSENTLKQQIVAAVEDQYIAALQDTTTGRHNGTIYEIIRHLFEVYGRVSPQMLFEQE